MQIMKAFFIVVNFLLFIHIGITNAKSLPSKDKVSTNHEKNIEKTMSKLFSVKGVPFSIDLAVTASKRGDDKLEHGIYLFKLKCSADASCGLERFSLNECTNKNGVISFTPRMDSWNTWSGFLEAKQLSDNELELVVFQAFEHLLPAKIILIFDPEGTPFKKLKSFEGSGFIDSRLWPDINTRIGYTGLHGNQTKQMDCPVFLPGI